MSAAFAPTIAEPRHRWLQFSLRTLMLVMLLISVLLGWYACELRWIRERREAIVLTEEALGGITYELAYPDTVQASLAWLGLLREDFSIDLIPVGLSPVSVDDARLVHVRVLTQLQEVSFNSAEVTDAGLVHLAGLKQLKTLELCNAHVTDVGLVHLKGLRQLSRLNLGDTKVTDAGLVHLRGLTHLKLLWLNDTLVTDAGVADLQKALPNVKIER